MAAAAAAGGEDAEDPYVVEAQRAAGKSGADDRATLEWVSSYFGAGQHWYFLDAEGEVQGPFTGDTMTSWYKSGYFWNDQMLVCHHGWDSYVTLQSVLEARNQLEDADEDGVAAAADGLRASPIEDVGSGGSVDNEEYGSDPESTGEAAAAAAAAATAAAAAAAVAGAYGPDVTHYDVGDDGAAGASGNGGVDLGDVEPQFDDVDQGGAGTGGGGSGAGGDHEAYAEEGDGDDGAAGSPSDEVSEWWYADANGSSQGPFTATQMQEWFQWEYFGATTLVRHTECEDFLSIEQLWPDTEEAFASDAWLSNYVAETGGQLRES